MLREIHIDKFNKIVQTFKPEIFNSLTVLQSKPYNQYVELYLVSDQHQQLYQLYRTDSPLEPILQEVPFIERSPRILCFSTQKDYIIIEEQIADNLYQYLLNSQSQSPYFVSLNEEKQIFARKVIRGLKASLTDYKTNNINYNAINPKNIVKRRSQDWQCSLVGLLFKNQKESEDYYKVGIQKEFQLAYALGTLLFKLLFGFVPFEQKKQFIKFNFQSYLMYLDKEENKKFLKVYSYAQGMLEASPLVRDLIEKALSGNMILENFYSHKYFEEEGMKGAKKEINPTAREIKMVSLFPQSQQSLVLAAIEHRKKYPNQRLNPQLKFPHQLTKLETINYLKKHPVLCQMSFDEKFKEEKEKGRVEEEQAVSLLNIPYFYREGQFDPELDQPCRDLLKLIENTRATSSFHDQQLEVYEAKMKMYAYPYAVAFELMKVSSEQPFVIKRKIANLVQDLLQISQLYYYPKIKPLHETHQVIKSFEDIKVRFRQLLNELYKYFLNEAIKKYNVKKDILSYQERSLSKVQGLQYYKLCLKLMECSVLNRKKGRDLDLIRIETSTRKQVEADLNHLLKEYFPNKIEHF